MDEEEEDRKTRREDGQKGKGQTEKKRNGMGPTTTIREEGKEKKVLHWTSSGRGIERGRNRDGRGMDRG